MCIKKESIFYDILNIPSPWVISVLSYSVHEMRIDFKIDYDSKVLNCPICSRDAMVLGKTPYSWKYLDIFQYETYMTAYLPLIDSHNQGCKANFDETVVNNVLLLDIIARQLRNSNVFNPLYFLFKAAVLGGKKPEQC